MTAVAEPATGKKIRNKDQYEVLRRYATGTDLNVIAKATGYTGDYVIGIVTTVADRNRQFARTLCLDWERTRIPETAAAPRASATPAPAATQATKPATPPGWTDERATRTAADAVKPAPTRQVASAAETAVTIHAGALIDQAAGSGDPHLERLAAKVRTLMVEIGERLERHTAERAAREKVAHLEAELAKARAELAGYQPARAAAKKSDGRAARIRAWCRGNGVEVNAGGPIGADAMAAYEAAHGGDNG